ncbi:MAG: hypothetical protein FH748_11520 [Balneolaceae bacterium]|nr:hypothetical protein [Balneolaceae bacterium]
MKMHSVIGRGFQEVIYQRCLKIEFEKEKSLSSSSAS